MSAAKSERILVTGASSGIGREVARQLAGPGRELLLVGRDPSRLASIAAEVRQAGAQAKEILLDLEDTGAVARFLDGELAAGGRIDTLYCLAAISIIGEVKDLLPEDWQRIYRTDLLGAVQMVHGVYSLMVKQGGGRIVLVSSLAAYAGYPTSVPYAAMKAGLVGLFRSLWHEGKTHGVKVHLASPGYVETGIFRTAIYRGSNYEDTMKLIQGMGFPMMPADRAAEALVDGVDAGRAEFAFPAYAKLMGWSSQRMPWMARPVHAILLKRFRSQDPPSPRSQPPLEWKGAVTLVTGAASGIGRALARRLVAAGAIVHAADLDAAKLEELRLELGDRLHPVALDVTDLQAWTDAVEGIRQRHGRLDILFNNAGVSWLGEAHQVPFERWKWLLDVNVMGVANGIMAVYPKMVKKGGGRIVNTASIAGGTGYATAAAYTCSKAAVLEMTRSLREEARVYGIHVSALCPGYVNTNIFTQDRVIGAKLNRVIDDLPVKQLGPDEAAAHIFAGVSRGKDTVVFPFTAKFLWQFGRWAPSLLGPIQRKFMKSFR